MARRTGGNFGVTVLLLPNEYDWFDDTRRLHGLSQAQMIREGLVAWANASGVEFPVSLQRTRKSYDRDEPRKRAYRDRVALYERRLAGERTSDLAREYGVSSGAMSAYFLDVSRERGTSLHLELSAETAAAIQRVLDDPFTSLTLRQREVAMTLLESRTYHAAGEKLGITRQAVHVVVRRIRQMAGLDDGRRKPAPQQQEVTA